jgi:hypothetical protein
LERCWRFAKELVPWYHLPANFFLYGSIIEERTVVNCAKPFYLRNELNIPLVVIGDGGK